MRRPTFAEVYMYKSLFWFAIAAFIFCPLLNNVVLQMVYWYVTTDVAYAFLVTPIGVIQEAVSLFSMYAGLAVLGVSVLYFGTNAKAVTVAAFVSHAVVMLSYMIAIYVGFGGITPEYIVEAFIVSAPDAAVMLFVYLVLLHYAKKKNTFMNIDTYTFSSAMKKHPYTKAFILTAVVYATVDIVVEAIGMIVYFVDPKNYFSLPSTPGEILNLVLQYVYILLFAAIGFVIMVLIGLMAQRLKDSGKRKAARLKEEKNS
jgi:hypothetical protein